MTHTQGGRGHKAPYETKMARVPVPLATQVAQIVNQYHNYVADGGDAESPPLFTSKPVNNFEQENKELREKLDAAMARIDELEASKAVNNFEAENNELREQLNAAMATIDELQASKAVNSFDARKVVYNFADIRDDYLLSLKLGKQSPEYKRTKKHLDNFIAILDKLSVAEQPQLLEPLVDAAFEIYEIGKDNGYLFSMLNKIAMQSGLRLYRGKPAAEKLYSELYFISPYNKPTLKLIESSSMNVIAEFLSKQHVKQQPGAK